MDAFETALTYLRVVLIVLGVDRPCDSRYIAWKLHMPTSAPFTLDVAVIAVHPSPFNVSVAPRLSPLRMLTYHHSILSTSSHEGPRQK